MVICVLYNRVNILSRYEDIFSTILTYQYISTITIYQNSLYYDKPQIHVITASKLIVSGRYHLGTKTS